MPGYGKAARILAAECYVEAKRQPAAAARLLAQRWLRSYGPLPRQPEEFVKRHGTKWHTTGSVADAPRSGRPLKLGKKEAAKAAKVFAAGYTSATLRVKGEAPVKEHHGFAGIKDALRRSVRLRSIKANAGVCDKAMFRRIKLANPKIKRHPRDVKTAKSEGDRLKRVTSSRLWLRRWRLNKRRWVNNLVCFDEGCIQVEAGRKRRRYEFYDGSCERWRYTLSHPKMRVKGGIKLWFYLAVNAVKGPLCLYPTTGTTNLKRRYTGVCEEPPGGYKVGMHVHRWGIMLAESKCACAHHCALQHQWGRSGGRSACSAAAAVLQSHVWGWGWVG